MKILTILGARPQFIKAAALSREFLKYPEIKEIIVHTGQHFDAKMSDVFFDEMGIPKPNYFLDINSMSHGAMTGRMIEKIEEILLIERPDWVLVFGDTNSTLAGAIAASKLQVKVAHVEAGLRSFNMAMPEEINRILTDRIASILFCPTDTSILNLKKEGFDSFNCQIIKTGDIMLDAALFYKMEASSKAQVFPKPPEGNFVLATIHRQENTDDKSRLLGIIEALNEINKQTRVILPLHPRTKKKLEDYKITTNIEVIEPLGYFDMLQLLGNCQFVMTDSGGLQKEAYFFKKPCITLRDQTEWTELLDAGVNLLAGADKLKILEQYSKISQANLSFSKDLYGSGRAAAEIVDGLMKFKS